MPNRPTTLQEELQQTKPFSSHAEEALVGLLRTASVVRRAIAQRIEKFGVSTAQYNVLRILRGAGAEGLPTLTVRDRLIEEAPGITRLIDKLEKAGHVARDRSGADRRTVRCCITQRGKDLLTEMDATVREGHELVGVALPTEREQRELITLLERVRAGI